MVGNKKKPYQFTIVKRSDPLIFILCTIAAIAFSPLSAGAITPQENMAKWYSEWIKSLPKQYRVTSKEFFGEKKDHPLVMICTNWTNGDNRLCSLDNFKVKNSYKLLINPRYAARIVTTLGSEDPVWSMENFAFRSDEHYQSVVADVGIPAGFGYDIAAWSKMPHDVTKETTFSDNSKKSIHWKFKPDAITGDRQPLEVVFTIDDSVSGMVVEVAVTERGGIRSRKVIDGWQFKDEVWIFANSTTYFQLPGQENEQLHSTKSWDFSVFLDPQPSVEGCLLSSYDLPEPQQNHSNTKYFLFLVALALLITGLALMRRNDK